MPDLSNQSILITGGTGTVGRSLLTALANLPIESQPKRVIVLSRDEYKQHLVQQDFPANQHPYIQYALADVSNYFQLLSHFRQVDTVIHAAALKRIEAGENQAEAFIEVNVNGTTNVLRAAIEQGVSQVVTISTDKAVYPTTLYGASKLCSERLTIQKNDNGTLKSSVIRLGNIFGSRGSVTTELLKKKDDCAIEITHPDMTRFTMSARQCAEYILSQGQAAVGGEIFIPKMKAYRLVDLIRTMVPKADITFTAPRLTEKIHESSITQEEARYGYERSNDIVICMDSATQSFYEQQPNTARTPLKKYTSNEAATLSLSEIAELVSTIS